MQDRLKTTFIKSVLAFALSSTFGRIINALAFIFLLKLLSPSEIGLVSIAAVFVTILSAAAELGFEAALVQAPSLSRRQQSGVFWLGLGLAGAAYLIVFLLAPVIAGFYQEPFLTALLRVYLLVLFINAFRIVPYSSLIRELKFGKISVLESLSLLIASLVMIFLAYRGWGAWSLVYAELARTGCLLIGSQVSAFFLPGMRFSLAETAPLIRFGFFATASRILYNLYTNSDYLIVGKFFGTASVGIYTLAYRLVFDTVKAGTGVINKVAYPTFAKLQDHSERLRRYFFSIARLNLAVLGLFLIVAAVFSDRIMQVLGYDKWLAAVPIIRMFCIIGLLRCVTPLIPQLLNALGHSKLNFYYSALCASVMPLAFYLGAQISLYGVVYAWLLIYPLVILLLIYFAQKYLRLSGRQFLTEFISSIKILLVSLAAVSLVRILFDRMSLGSKPFTLAVALVTSLAFGLLSIFFFDKKISAELRTRFRRR